MTNGTQDPQKPGTAFDDIFAAGSARFGQEPRSGFDDIFSAGAEMYGKRAEGVDWWLQFGQRAGASLVDSALVRPVDAVTRGWALIGQHVQDLFGDPSIEGKGVFERMTGRQAVDTTDVLGALGIRDPEQREGEGLGEYARRVWQEKLGPDGYMAASLAGELAGFAAPSGPMALVGRGAAPLGAALAAPVQRFYARKLMEGTMQPEMVRRLAESGQLLAEMARLGGWQPKVVQAIPGLAGEYGALMAQMYAAAPRGEGMAAVEHAMVPGMAFLGIGRGARWLGGKILDRSLSETAKGNLLTLHDAIQNGTRGRAGSTWNAFRSLPMADKAKVLGVQVGVSAAEALGFSLTDQHAITDLFAAYSGDPDAWDRVIARFGGTWAGVMVTKAGLPLDAVPYFKRVAPDLNSWRTERARQRELEAEKQPQEPPQEPLQEPQAQREPRPTVEQQRARIADDVAVQRVVDPLLRSGFTMSEPRLDQPTPVLRLTEPGGGDVLVHVGGAGAPKVVVSQKIWNTVRPRAEEIPGEVPGGGPGIVLEGRDAESFLTDLGLRAAAMRMRATLRFGRMGFDEAPFAEGWRDPATGMDHAFSLDGEPMRRDPSDGRWHRVPADDALRGLLAFPVGERALEPAATYFSPELGRWGQFIQEKMRSFPEPAVDDVLAMGLSTAQFGGQTQSAAELRRFFEAIDPAIFASKLNAQTAPVMAHTVAAIGGGLTNAEAAAKLLDGLPVAGPQKLLAAPEEGPGLADPTGIPYTTGRERPEAEAPAGVAVEPARPPEGAREAGPPSPRGEPGPPRPGEVGGRPGDPEAPDRPLAAGAAAPERVTLSDAILGGRPVAQAVRGEREGEAGRLRAPDISRLAELVEGAGSIPSRYAEPLAQAVGRRGGKEAKKFGKGALEVLSRTRELIGEIDVSRRALEKAAAGRAGEFAEQTRPLGKGGEVRVFRELVEERLPESEIPAEIRGEVATLKEAGQEAVFSLGRQAQRAGVLQQRGGQYVPFTVEGRKGILPRTAGKDFARVMEDPALRKQFAENVASHPQNKTTVDQVLSVITPTARKVTALEREAQYEQARQWPIQPDVLVAPDGRRLDVWESRPGPAIEALVHSQTARTATVETFGQDLPEAVRTKLGLREGVQPVLERVAGEMSGADFRAAEALAARMQGVGTGGLGKLEGLAEVEGIRRAALTVRAGIYDISDPWNVVPSFFGYGRLFRAIAENAGSVEALRSAYAEAIRFGSIVRDMGNYAISEATEIPSLIRDILTAPGRLTEKTKQLIADVYIKRTIGDWRAGKSTLRDRVGLERLGYDVAEIDAILSGNATKNLYRRVRHEFVQQAASNFRPGEGSALHQSRAFNFWVPFQRFFTGRVHLTAQALNSFGRAVRSGDPQRIRIATQTAIQLALGAMVSGGISKWLSYLLSGRDTDEFVKDLSYAPVGFLLRGAAEQMVGGMLLQTATSLLESVTGEADPREELGRVFGPAQPVFEAILAAGGTASYRGKSGPEKMVTLAERVALGPISQTGMALAGAVGIGEDHDTQAAVRRFYKWPGRKTGGSEPESEALWAEMRRVGASLQDAIDRGTGLQDEHVLTGLRKALGIGTGDNIANSLIGRRIVQGLDSEQTRDLAKFMGEEGMAKLYAYDNALTLLADQYRDQPGTPQPREPLEAEIQTALEQARLGSEAAWGPLKDRVVSHQAERMIAGSLDLTEVRMLARAMALFPETLSRVLSDQQALMLKMAGRERAQMMLEAILLQSAEGSAGNLLRKKMRK